MKYIKIFFVLSIILSNYLQVGLCEQQEILKDHYQKNNQNVEMPNTSNFANSIHNGIQSFIMLTPVISTTCLLCGGALSLTEGIFSEE